MKLKQIIGLIIILGIAQASRAQRASDQYPVRFGLYQYSLNMTNPAFLGAESRAAVTTGYQGYSGLRKNIRTFYLVAHTQLPSKEEKEIKHFVGLTAYSDREGDFIRRSRAYFNYALNLPISANWNVAAGGSLGAANYVVASSKFRPGGSSFVFDGNAGIHLSDDKNALGISINQLFDQVLQPLRQQITLLRHYNIYYSHQFELSQNVSLLTLPWIRLVEANVLAGLVGTMVFKDRYQLSMNYAHQSTLTTSLGLKNINLEKNGLFDLSIGFHLPTGQQGQLNSQQFEIGLYYHVKNKKESEVTK